MDEQSERTNIAELTTEIVAAYVSYHQVGVLDVPNVINGVGIELASLGIEAEPRYAGEAGAGGECAALDPTRSPCVPDLW
jgi:predicted transcriptional regulator